MFNLLRAKQRAEPLTNQFAGGYSVQFRLEPESLRQLYASLDQYEPRARRTIMRGALRKWSKLVALRMKANAYPNAVQTKRHVLAKVKTFRRALWCGVGVETGYRPPGQELRGRYGELLPGWRSHLYEVGWRAYPRNYLGDEARRAGRGKGWRKGLRNRGGRLRYETKYMSRAYYANRNTLAPQLEKAIAEYNRRITRASERAARSTK